MQRWIAAGVVALVLLLGGTYFAYRTYQHNRPQPVWVPLPINPELESAKRDEIIKDLKAKLSAPDLLIQVSKDLGLPQKWNLPSDAECAKEIANRLFIRPGDADSSIGSVPAIHIGIKGKVKESAVSGEIAMRLMEDVWKILGIEPPKKKGS
jgi:hypothetical protein